MEDKEQKKEKLEDEISNENVKSENANSENAETSAKTDESELDLNAKIAELNDLYLRKCADFDNYRKRMIKEKQEAFDFANTNILTDLISILDNFDLCLASCEKAQDTKSVVDGVKMIYQQLFSMLESKHNLLSYGKVGDEFDPNLHEALAKQDVDDVEKPTCAEIYQKGYKLHDRVIRHAKVLVKMPKE